MSEIHHLETALKTLTELKIIAANQQDHELSATLKDLHNKVLHTIRELINEIEVLVKYAEPHLKNESK